jgi:hypothetical protein
MKTLIKSILAAILLSSTVASQAGTVSGYYRSSGTYVAPHYRSDYGSLGLTTTRDCVYRNPYAADPTVQVSGYYRSSGTYVAPYVRTPANDTVTDNLSYRGYGTIRVPRSSPADSSSQPSAFPKTMPYYGGSTFGNQVLPSTGNFSSKPLHRHSSPSGAGF